MSTGLGDVIKNVTEFLNIEQCEPCQKRQAEFNRLFPFIKRPTNDEIVFLYEVFSWYKGLPIPLDKVDDIKKCEALFRKLYNIKEEACTTCGSTYQNNYMKKLERVYLNYKDLIEKEMQTEKPKRERKANIKNENK